MVERVVFNALARSLRLCRLIYLRLRRSIHCHRLTEKPIHRGTSLAAGSFTRLSTETLRKNHGSLTSARQGEGVVAGGVEERPVVAVGVGVGVGVTLITPVIPASGARRRSKSKCQPA
jgi:hypothetical protein